MKRWEKRSSLKTTKASLQAPIKNPLVPSASVLTIPVPPPCQEANGSPSVGHTGLYNELRQGFDEFKWSIQSVMIDGNLIAVRSEWAGNSSVRLLMFTVGTMPKVQRGMPADPDYKIVAGKKCAVRTFHYLTFRDGKIVSGEFMVDWCSMASQLGLWPPPELLRDHYENARGLFTPFVEAWYAREASKD
jgi:hypothetical protein